MTKKIKISIIIPVYNVETFLETSITCIINQTIKNIEIICINDNSSDNSLQILKKFQQNDKRIKIINLEKNMGAAHARNLGLDISSGEYIGFFDPDDIVDLNFYEQLLINTYNGSYDIVKAVLKTYEYNGKINISNKNQLIAKNKFYFNSEWTTAIYNRKMLMLSKIIFPEECRKGHDIVFLFRCILNAQKIKTVNNIFYHYLRRDNSLSSRNISIQSALSAMTALKIIASELNSNAQTVSISNYIHIYMYITSGVLYTLNQNNSDTSIDKYAETLIQIYNSCQHKSVFVAEYKKLIKFNKMLKLIIANNHSGLCLYFKNKEYDNDVNIVKKIFSIGNSKCKQYKLLRLFGFTIKLTNQKK